ncbi:coiled-coil domain-containing protein [Bacteroides timonensis]|uniref:hypothetical protein n=1 Tax=Bacteroides timonensis TaxID=1470345 RepID=UPI0004B4C232|nr:hypothetical protein [Bacteroides timonensis]
MKKWTYLVAAGMLLGATPVFTGCIDNDEPEGITVLRGAKAELLKAKSAVEAAKVAQVQADAALTQAQAKVQEAEAIKIQAEAKKIEAEAKIAEAEAALLNAQTESEKARLQGIIEENQRLQKEWEENAAVRAAEAEAAIQEAEYKALQAKAKYQQALVSLQSAQQRVLQPYITALNTATGDYFDALDDLRIAQRNLNKQAATVEENEASKELLTRSLTKDVSLKESALKGYQDAQAVAEEELATAKKDLKQSDLITKREEVTAKAQTVLKEMSDLNVEAAEKIAGFFTGGRFEALKSLLKEYNDAVVAPQTIAAVEFDFGDGAGYPTYWQRGKMSLPEAEYSSVKTDSYINQQATLSYLLNLFTSWTRDENDNAWTQERIVKLEGELAELEKDIKSAKDAWQEAVNAYNTNKYNTSDMTKISGYDKVVSEITAFNKAADEANKANAEQVRLERKQVTDQKTKTDALNKNTEVADAAKLKAMDDHRAAMDKINETVTTKKAKLKTTLDKATEATKAAKEAYDKIDSKKEAEKAAALAVWQAAEKEQTAAQTAYDAYNYNAELTLINKAYDDAVEAATAQKKKADDAAKDAYNKLWGNTGTDAALLKTAVANVTAKEKALETARKNLVTASNAYNNKLTEYTQYTQATPIDVTIINTLANGTYNDKDGYSVRKTDLTSTKLIVLDKEALIYVVKVRSEALFGTAIYGRNEYGDFDARLKDLKDDEILKLINTAMDEFAEEYGFANLNVYMNQCNSYGLAGDRLAVKEMIRIAKSWLNNGKLIQGKIDQAQKALNDLTSAFDANEKAIEAKLDAFEVAHETLLTDIATATEPIEKKAEELKPLYIIYSAIQESIEGYELAGETMWTEETIKEFIAELELKVETCKVTVYDADTALMWAKDRLAKWNSDDLTRLEIMQNAVEEAQALVDRKKKELDNAQEALDAMLASLSVE